MTSSWAAERWAPRAQGQLIILDNRDSFVFNLAHRLHEVGSPSLAVVRSDQIALDELVALKPCALVISPGPGHPAQAGISVEAIRALGPTIPILGVCLGHQAIGHAYGGLVERNSAPMHGRASPLSHVGQGVFEGIEQGAPVGRYHSLVVREPLPEPLEPLAWSQGWLMALRHKEHPTLGLQFHPESVLSPIGHALLRAWLKWLK